MRRILYVMLLSTCIFADAKYPSLQDIKDNIYFGKPLNLDAICSITDNMKKIKIKDINKKSQRIEIIGYYDKTTKIPSGSWKIKVDGEYLDREECYDFNERAVYIQNNKKISLVLKNYIFKSYTEEYKVIILEEKQISLTYKSIDGIWIEEEGPPPIPSRAPIDYLINSYKVRQYFKELLEENVTEKESKKK